MNINKKIISVTVITVLFILVINGLNTALNFSLVDSRYASYKYVNNLGINQTNTLYDGYSPFFPTYYSSPVTLAPQNQYKYVITSSYVYDRYFIEPYKHSKPINYYSTVFNYTLLKEFVPITFSDAFNIHQTKSIIQLIFPEYRILIENIQYLNIYRQDPSQSYQGPIIRVYEAPDTNVSIYTWETQSDEP